MATIKLLGISGALRKASTNTMLVREAARLMGDDVALTEADLNLPLYDGDVEEAKGVPAQVQALADQIAEADAIVISTPEYNKGITGVLKNALDWVSRTEGNPWAGKPVVLMSSAAGRAGGERGQVMLNACMTPFGVRIISGPEIAIAANFNEFDDAGRLKGERYIKNLTALMEALRKAL